jgi:hypothetical protein
MAREIRYDRFVSKGNTFVTPVCNDCRWNFNDGTCRAFPQGIPEEILAGRNNHEFPLGRQRNNITFESIEEETQ